MIKNCKMCNKEFRGFKSDEKYNRGICCGRKCFYEYFKIRFPQRGALGKHWKHTEEYNKNLSIARTGKKNPQYINGESRYREERSKIRAWRDEIFKRDNWTCQICKKIGGDLNAHHIIQWCISKDDRFKIDNGITLCLICHRMVHKTKKDILWYRMNYERLIVESTL